MAGAPDTYSSPIDFRITKDPQPVTSDRASYQNFKDVYDSIQQIIYTFIKYLGVGTFDRSFWSSLSADPGQLLFEGNLNKIYIIAKVAIAAGQYISLINDAGVLKAQLASGVVGSTFWADGYSTGIVAAGSVGEFILGRGNNKYLSGLTIGQRYWIGGPGAVRTTPATLAGQLEQYIGIAVTTTELATSIAPAIQH